MSRYDGLIIPRSYSEYINKTDAATLQQALQLSGVLSGAVAAGDNKAVKSSAVNAALANVVTSSRIPTNTTEATLLLRNKDSKVFGEFAITPINDISKWFSFCQITKPKNGENVEFTLTENGISPATPIKMYILGLSGIVQNGLILTAGKRYYGTFYYEI